MFLTNLTNYKYIYKSTSTYQKYIENIFYYACHTKIYNLKL